MVDGESLLNDGTGLVLFAIAVQAVVAPISPVEASSRLRRDRGVISVGDRPRDRLARDRGSISLVATTT